MSSSIASFLRMYILERCNLAVPFMTSDTLPKKLPVTSLHQWTRVNYEDVCQLPHAVDYVQSGVITTDCVIYLAKLTCGSGEWSKQ